METGPEGARWSGKTSSKYFFSTEQKQLAIADFHREEI